MSDGSGLRIDLRRLIPRARRWVDTRVTNATVNLGFISFDLAPKPPERTAARQLVIKIRDKRVLTASDCCDNCVRNSIASLQDVRKTLVDTQVQLADLHDGQFFWLMDYMLATIRAFLTWDEMVRAGSRRALGHDDLDADDPARTRQYIAQLDVLRAHLQGGFAGIASVAGMDLQDLPGTKLSAALALAAERRYVQIDSDDELVQARK